MVEGVHHEDWEMDYCKAHDEGVKSSEEEDLIPRQSERGEVMKRNGRKYKRSTTKVAYGLEIVAGSLWSIRSYEAGYEDDAPPVPQSNRRGQTLLRTRYGVSDNFPTTIPPSV